MKIFCISGAPGSDLSLIENIFTTAGVAAPKTPRTDPVLNFSRWHGEVLSAENNFERSLKHPGRLWEQLAGSLFLENLSTPLWGWADAASTWLLDFWREFEPAMHFILVCQSPQRALSLALSQGMDCDPAAVLGTWHRYHQELLRFHLRHPERSLLVDAGQCEAAPKKLIDACGDQWRLTFPGAVAQACPPTAVSPLSSYLARQLCQQHADVDALQAEIQSSLRKLCAPVAMPSTLVEALHEFALLQQQPIAAQALRKELEQHRDEHKHQQEQAKSLAAQLQDSQARLASTQHKLDWTETQKRELAQELDTHRTALPERDQMKAQLQAVQAGVQEGQRENEVLLSQLQHVQRELEHYFMAYEAASLAHQEALACLQRMQARTPDYYDYDCIQAHVEEATHDAATISWQISRLALPERDLPELRFQTVHTLSKVEFIVDFADSEAGAGLLRWPLPGASTVRLIVDATPEAPEDVIGRLASSDFDLLLALCKLLANALEQGEVSPEGVPPQALVALLRQTLQQLQALPPVLRYDRVHLKREQRNVDYEHLWLEIDNLSAGPVHLPVFGFRLSCANVEPGRFGSYPKLEFPADGARAALENWFGEASDDFGDKLELRFALPADMDLTVWQHLSVRDRHFVAALLLLLPALLDDLERRQVDITRTWSDWREAALNMLAILCERAAAQPAVRAA
ncbi:hypothetical protein [Massilia genomosp. 1]|uniref:Uncharacterized protein n=1 Tax=Massilia genomosp. 1 TaxID=2609280 RepID=A0ABX0N063_9BURK|nr:hypothetical protein [Massilia genomosp. 1]NHZ64909.1 hypothetical protein [Massilia genomosp. 1]